MANNQIKTRIIHKHDTEANWELATNFIPKQGEIIVYDKDSTHSYERFKIGDGSTIVSSLPFANDALKAEIQTLLNDKASVSSVTQLSNEVDKKVDKDGNKVLSTNDYTTVEKNKLAGIAAGAQVNQNAFSNVVVGSTTIAADSKTDTLTFVAGTNITLTPDATNDKITITAKDTTYSNATTSAAGLMSADDKTKFDAAISKLDGIANNANNYSLPTASSSTKGGVKTGAAITDTTGYTAVHIKDGVIYYKDTNTNLVTSVFGRTGAVSLTKDDVTTALGYTPPTTNTTYSLAKYNNLGLVKPAYSSTGAAILTTTAAENTSTPTIAAKTTTSGRYYAVEADKNGIMFVNVPWTNTHAVSSVAGKTGAVTLTSSDVGLGNVENKSSATIRGELTKANVTDALGYTPPTTNTTYTAGTGLSLSSGAFSVKTGYTTSGKNYKVQADSNGNLYVNVPWTDSTPVTSVFGRTGAVTLTKSDVTTALGYTPPTTDTNTHYTTRLYAGASETVANAAATNPYLKVTDDNIYRNQIQFKGSGATTVSSDANGVITISSTDTNTHAVTSVFGRTGAVTLTKSDVTTALGYTPPTTDTNTTYSTATSSTLGLVKIGYTTSGKNYAVQLSNGQMYVNVPWTDTNTTYNAATTSAAGLMSASDKSKLDGITSSADSVSFSRSLTSGTKIGTITINGTGTDLYCQTNTNTTYSAGTGLSLSGTTFNHSNSITAATAQGDASKTLAFNDTFTIPTITYDAQGHITGKGTTTMTMPVGPVAKEGNPVSEIGIAGAGFSAETIFEPKQEGSGDPSPNNIRPISGRTDATLTRCGVNIFPPGEEKTGTMNGITFVSDGNGKYTLNGTSTGSAAFVINLVKPVRIPDAYVGYFHMLNSVANGYFTFGFIENGTQTSFSSATIINRIRPIDEFGSLLRGRTIDAVQLFVSGSGRVFDNFSLAPMLLQTGTLTDYKPYTGDTYAADFGQTVYGGTLDWQTGVLTVDNAMVTLDGTNQKALFMSVNADYIQVRLGDHLPDAINRAGNGCLICSHLIEQYGIYSDFPYPHVYLDVSGTPFIRAYFPITIAKTADELNAYLAAQYAAGTPVQVCYKLATPTTIQLTPHDLRMISGTNTVYSDGNTNYVIFNSGASSLGKAYELFFKKTDTIPVSNGGTGSTSKSGARTNLGITSGTSLPSSGSTGDIFFLY